MRIFVSIASYRDRQLLPTIADCLVKAKHPDRLRFGICWQHGPEETEPPLTDQRFRVLDVDWRASRGACWARAEIMRLWEGEEFYLQLDSHHRFVQDWDVKLVSLAEQTSSPKPIVSTYPPPFTPGNPDSFETEPLQIDFDRFTQDGIPTFKPEPIPDLQTRTRPLRARFVSAGFMFTIGDFVAQVPYDPELYFEGEEITLAIRAYTSGFDLFHPHEIVVWHYYTRTGEPKHWDDHAHAHGFAPTWLEQDRISKTRVRAMLDMSHVGGFGCGTARTLGEYQAYAGLHFASRRLQDYTRSGYEPPNPPAPADWTERVNSYDVRISLDRSALPHAAKSDPDFWYVGFHDADEREIHRQDASDHELAVLLAGDTSIVNIDRRFEASREPVSWTVWPFSRSQGWLERIRGPVPARDAT